MVDISGNSFLKRMLGAAFVVVMLLIAGCGDIYGHDEFDKMVMNKSEDAVTTEVGKPESVDKSNPAHVVWTYYSKTYDINNENKRDSRTMVIFTPNATGKLQVAEVKYEH